MSFSVIIPARYQSTRLPGKPLLDIAGKSMIERVYQQVTQTDAERIIVATDDPRIEQAVNAFGGQTCMTASHHQSGTQRLAEVISKLAIEDDHIIVNVQGDEPLIPPELIQQLADNLANTSCPMATLAVACEHPDEVFNPNVVKVVVNAQQHALYFSRAPIPWHRDSFAKQNINVPQPSQDSVPKPIQPPVLRHIGIYAYRAGFIRQYLSWSTSPLEEIESLEQLRILWHGQSIHVDIAKTTPPAGVDTQEDLEHVRAIAIAGGL